MGGAASSGVALRQCYLGGVVMGTGLCQRLWAKAAGKQLAQGVCDKGVVLLGHQHLQVGGRTRRASGGRNRRASSNRRCFPTTARRVKDRQPSLMAFTRAVRSAQMVEP